MRNGTPIEVAVEKNGKEPVRDKSVSDAKAEACAVLDFSSCGL